MTIYDTLRTTNSSIDKERMLRTICNENDKHAFFQAYNPDITYGLTYAHVPDMECKDYDSMFELLDYLDIRSLTGNAARAAVDSFASKNGNLIKAICNKDMACGVTATTLNKVFGKDFIPSFKIQKATEVPLDKLKYPLLAQIKYNGVRVLAFVKYDSVIFKSSSGKVFEFPALESLILMNISPGVVLDGELCVGDSKGLDHTSVSGYQNSAIKGTPIRVHGLHFNVFDTLKIAEFNDQSCAATYHTRLCTLAQVFSGNVEHCNHIVKLCRDQGRLVYSHEEAQEYFNEVYSNGYEGLILKSLEHKYQFRRSKDWVKIKAIKDCDLVCIGIQEGTGKYFGAIGGLICRGTVEGKLVHVVVGSGLTDAQRMADPNSYLDQTIEVIYNEVIQDTKTGGWSLFLPRFSRVRTDK